MKTGFVLKKRQRDLAGAILALAVLMQMVLWARMNLKYFYIYDYDAANLFYHVICMWREKAFVIPDWVYMTTGEWDCASLPALLFYGMTGDIKQAFGLANTCNVVLFAFVISRVFKAFDARQGRGKAMLLAIALLLMPYCWGQLDYANMLFYSGAQYIYKVLLPVWLVSLYVGMPKRKLPAALYAAVFYLLVFATASSSGVYVFACGLFPVLCCWFVRAVGMEKQRFDYKGCWISILTVLVFGAGFAAQRAAELSTKTDMMALIPIERVMPNIAQTVEDFLYVMRILPKEVSLEIFALEAFISYFKIGILLVMLIVGLGELKHCFMIRTAFAEPERMHEGESFVKACLASVFVWNLFILTLTESTPRYHLIGFIPFTILACMSLAQKLEACSLVRMKNFLWMAIAAATLLLAALLFIDARDQVTNEKEKYSELIIYEAGQQDADTVIFLDDGWWAERTRPLDPDRVYVAYSSSLQKMINYDVPASFNDMGIFSKRHMLVTQAAYPIERLPESMRERYTLVKDEWGVQFYMAEDVSAAESAE